MRIAGSDKAHPAALIEFGVEFGGDTTNIDPPAGRYLQVGFRRMITDMKGRVLGMQNSTGSLHLIRHHLELMSYFKITNNRSSGHRVDHGAMIL
jgi:hypothetical protein